MDRTQDRALIAGLQSGSHESLRQVADLYGPRVFQLAMRHVKNREDAEEITQDVLMKVYRKAGSFRGDAALSSWIYRITFNTAMSRLRQRHSARAAEQKRDAARVEAWDQPSPVPSEPADWSRMPDEELFRLELRRAVAAAIHDLPEIYRGPIILRDLEGLTTEEARTRLRLKDETLKSRLHRGRLLLRERLRSVLGLQSPVFGRSPVFGLR
jgi:RNA polymerase sigma-70 factor (ECF subfamily)